MVSTRQYGADCFNQVEPTEANPKEENWIVSTPRSPIRSEEIREVEEAAPTKRNNDAEKMPLPRRLLC